MVAEGTSAGVSSRLSAVRLEIKNLKEEIIKKSSFSSECVDFLEEGRISSSFCQHLGILMRQFRDSKEDWNEEALQETATFASLLKKMIDEAHEVSEKLSEKLFPPMEALRNIASSSKDIDTSRGIYKALEALEASIDRNSVLSHANDEATAEDRAAMKVEVAGKSVSAEDKTVNLASLSYLLSSLKERLQLLSELLNSSAYLKILEEKQAEDEAANGFLPAFEGQDFKLQELRLIEDAEAAKIMQKQPDIMVSSEDDYDAHKVDFVSVPSGNGYSEEPFEQCVQQQAGTSIQHRFSPDDRLVDVPDSLKNLYNSWTSDGLLFFQQATKIAQKRPFSKAYVSGDPTATRRNRDGVYSSLEHLYALNWQRTLDKLQCGSSISLPNELLSSYAVAVMDDIVKNAAENPDFLQENSKYPGISRACMLFKMIRNR